MPRRGTSVRTSVGPSLRRLTPAAVFGLALAACADPTTAPPSPPGAPALARADAAGEAGQPIPGAYIVVFRDDVADVRGKAADKARRVGAGVAVVYERALRGFAGPMSDAAAAQLRGDPEVAYVEQDQVVSIDVVSSDATTQPNATWGLDRIDQRSLPLSTTYTYTGTGSGVAAYIIDTGIRTTHGEFAGRAVRGFDAFTDGQNANDCNGHGTHVAGTVGGATYGVAKGVKLVAVRVLDCGGSGSNAGVIKGMDWVAEEAAKNVGTPAVANMSLGGGFSQATNDAIARLTAANVFVAVAAGNSSQDACRSSPASAPSATTVAASARDDARASYSNWGSCVDLYAPGSSITSAWYQNDSQLNTISGTSMASPHVAGVGALYRAANPGASPAAVDAAIKAAATQGKITGNRRGTPNLLLFANGL
jgi:subtilisin family serine protease